MAARERDTLVCPRCGQPLHRERRRAAHRLLSIVYPVRYYACSGDCGWSGLFFAASQFNVRKRRLFRVAIVLLLAFCGIMAARYLASSSNPSAEEAAEE